MRLFDVHSADMPRSTRGHQNLLHGRSRASPVFQEWISGLMPFASLVKSGGAWHSRVPAAVLACGWAGNPRSPPAGGDRPRAQISEFKAGYLLFRGKSARRFNHRAWCPFIARHRGAGLPSQSTIRRERTEGRCSSLRSFCSRRERLPLLKPAGGWLSGQTQRGGDTAPSLACALFCVPETLPSDLNPCRRQRHFHLGGFASGFRTTGSGN